MQVPLSDHGRISNSIANYVLEHPDNRELIPLYNGWVHKESKKNFPLHNPDTLLFCLQIFETCLKLPRDLLAEIQEDEASILCGKEPQ